MAMKRTHPPYFVLAFLAAVFVLSANPAQSEMYIAAQGGVTLPNDLTNIENSGLAAGLIRISDLDLDTSGMVGGKVGYFFDSAKWLGVETEAFYTTPHVKQQTVTLSTTVPGIAFSPGTATGLHLQVVTWAINAILRYPGEMFQPYAGAGLGVFFARLKGGDDGEVDSSDSAVPGLNVVAGARVMVTKSIALFGEYKYNRATFDFDDAIATDIGFKGDYSANIIAGGISFHFN